ncbi:MAG TPA: esterase-like activity of phytase family protein [Longimicrobium sp.]|jgi:hypothetical protein|nr:esterase-like activity of phytase family protein [Longimicrobium sp.]
MRRPESKRSSMRFSPFLALLFAAACTPVAVVTQQPAEAESSWAARLDIQATPLPLNPQDPSQTVVGRLRYMGGVQLTSSDPRFGGLSGLRWYDGQLLAVSDEGDFFRMTLEEQDERLVGVREVRMRRLTGPDGQPLSGKAESDAEALELEWDGRWCLGSDPCQPSHAIVSFEGTNALWKYRLSNGLPDGAPTGVPQSTAWRRALPQNGGVEGMAGGWMVSEQLREPDGSASGRLTEWIRFPSGFCSHCDTPMPLGDPIDSREMPMNLPVSDGFAPTDAANSSGAIIVLQRRYSPEAGNAARVVRFRPEPGSGEITGLETLAEFLPPLTLDNFEGLAAGGGRFIYIVSDNNFSPTQRTLLLKFQVID